MTSYVGTEGDAEGVLLKIEGGAAAKALKEAPKSTSLELGSVKVEVKQASYDNGDEVWTSTHALIKALNYGMVKSKSKYATLEVKSAATDAKPKLSW